MSKYLNQKTTVNGLRFDSGKEAAMYHQLHLMEKAGQIQELQTQVPFTILRKFVNANGEKVRAIKYIADFTFYDVKQKRIRVIDCKGYKTDVYKIKKKLFDSMAKDQGLYLEENI